MMTDVLILAVTYNTPDETLRFLESIKRQHYNGVQVVLTDNSENIPDRFEDRVQQALPGTVYLRSGKNEGYFGGAKTGLEHYLKGNTLPEWIMVSNVDIVFNQVDFFKKLNSMDFPPSTGVIAPAIISDKWKTDSNPKIISRYTRKKMEFYRMVCTNALSQNMYMTLSYLKKLMKGKGRDDQRSERRRMKIYAPHGSCILFKKIFFERGGNLDHISFLFGEEIFVGETAIKLGLEVYYEPQLVVDDFEHASTGFFYSKKVAGFMKQSTDDIISHYYQA